MLASDLRSDLEAHAFAVETQLARVVETVAGTAALIEAAPGLGDGDFATYTARMLARLPVLEALEWSPRGSAGEPAREEALQRAVETGEVTISDPIHAARAEPGGWSFLLVAPVRAPPPAETERRPPVRGFAIGVVRFADLIAAAFSERATTGGGRLAWQLAGEDAGGRGVVLWSSVTSGAVEEPRAGASLQRTIVAGGQRWTLVARPTDSALRAGRSSSPALLGAASFSGWQLLVALSAVLTWRGRERQERRRIERERAEQLTQRLASAVEQTADGVLITDRSGVIEYVNPAFEQTTGYSRAEAVGATPRLLRSEQQGPDFYRELWATILSGKPYKGLLFNRRKSGDVFAAEQTITPMRDAQTGEVSHFVSVLRDLTERTRLNEQETELRLAAAVQQRLYPDPLPRIAGFDIAGGMVPALTTCGDYFDFIALPDGRLAVVVADACGHGVGPALIMAVTRAYLRSLTALRGDIEGVVRELNRLLLADLEAHLYVTMVLGVLDPGSGVLTWANMGHPAGYVLDAHGAEKSRLSSTCLPLGMFAQLGAQPGRTTQLAPGDLVVLLTDGVIETSSPEDREFGPAAMLDVVRGCRHETAERIVAAVLGAARVHAAGQARRDDVTVVAIKRDG